MIAYTPRRTKGVPGMLRCAVCPNSFSHEESNTICAYFTGYGRPAVSAQNFTHEQACDMVIIALAARNAGDVHQYEMLPADMPMDKRAALFERMLPRKTPHAFDVEGRVLYDHMADFDEQRKLDRKKKHAAMYHVTWCITCMFKGKRLWFYGIKSRCGRSFPLLMTTGAVGGAKSYSPRLFCEFFERPDDYITQMFTGLL